jgi:hypothetical protein
VNTCSEDDDTTPIQMAQIQKAQSFAHVLFHTKLATPGSFRVSLATFRSRQGRPSGTFELQPPRAPRAWHTWYMLILIQALLLGMTSFSHHSMLSRALGLWCSAVHLLHALLCSASMCQSWHATTCGPRLRAACTSLCICQKACPSTNDQHA